MFFSFKPILATALVALTLSLERPSTKSPCGNANIASAFATSKAATLNADGSFTASITNFNGGVDGSREITSAKVDASGTGKSFVAATVTQNGDKAPSTTGTQQLTIKLPAGTSCKGAGGNGAAGANTGAATGAAATTGKKAGGKKGSGKKNKGAKKARAFEAIRSFFESQRTARAAGSRAASIARRAAEAPAVEALA
ncbi:uncharacterized protein BXZ73DRAFT_111031 [Epithele typhae]|uniref:uncharacterized protein n=1 Tax=Epithele typhae TaxID=378194 RepID=UPI0020076EA6|nr:uncharacterized protein BXZ73DRAFT_111031 [Epithele typhae]KAH9905088.1 hypothetical protein BXZ73DRAFT_111031 [Epithele typhae]